MFYKQCQLRRGSAIDVAWIPEQFAKLDKILRLKRDGEWSDGWVVHEVYGRLPQEVAESGRDEYRYHREVTDV